MYLFGCVLEEEEEDGATSTALRLLAISALRKSIVAVFREEDGAGWKKCGKFQGCMQRLTSRVQKGGANFAAC